MAGREGREGSGERRAVRQRVLRGPAEPHQRHSWHLLAKCAATYLGDQVCLGPRGPGPVVEAGPDVRAEPRVERRRGQRSYRDRALLAGELVAQGPQQGVVTEADHDIEHAVSDALGIFEGEVPELRDEPVREDVP